MEENQRGDGCSCRKTNAKIIQEEEEEDTLSLPPLLRSLLLLFGTGSSAETVSRDWTSTQLCPLPSCPAVFKTLPAAANVPSATLCLHGAGGEFPSANEEKAAVYKESGFDFTLQKSDVQPDWIWK